MSSQVGSATKKAQSEVPETPTKAGHPTESKLDKSAPRSIPDINDSESQADVSNSGEGDEGEMVPAAGRINEKGEVIDDDGNAIGKVTSGNAKDFVDFIVTQEGDILDSNGGVVGKAEPLEDVASELNDHYTTGTGAAKDTTDKVTGDDEDEGEEKSGGGLGGALGGVGNAAKGAVGGVGKTAKGVTGAVGDTTKGATDTVGDATGTKDATDKVGDTVKGTTDTVGDTTEGATDTVGETTKGATDTADEATKPVTDTVDDATGGATEKAGDAAGDVGDKVGETTEGVGETAEGATDKVGETAEGATDKVGETTEGATDKVGETTEGAKEDLPEGADVEGAKEDLPEGADVEGAKEGLPEGADDTVEGAKDTADGAVEGAEEGVEGTKEDLPEGADVEGAEGKLDETAEGAEGAVDEAGEGVEGVQDEAGSKVEGAEGELEGAEGELGSKAGDLEKPIEIPEFAPTVAEKVVAMFEGPFTVAEDGQVKDQNGKILGKLAEDTDLQELIGKDIKGIDGEGNLLGDNDTVLGKVDLAPEGTIAERIKEEVPEAAERLDAIEEAKNQLPPLSVLEGLNINKAGNVVDEKGNVLGRVKEGDIKKLVGKQPDAEGKVWDSKGNVIGEVEVVPEAIESLQSPFEDFPDATVEKDGIVVFEGRQVGVVIEGDAEKLIGKKVDADGDILDKNGNVIGKAERKEAEEAAEPEPEAVDYSVLKDKKVNKAGNVVDEKGQIWGHIVEGILKNLVGKKVGSDNGEIFNDAGKVIGKAEPIPEQEREEAKDASPFEDFPDATVEKDGIVVSEGRQIGIVVEGDHDALVGKKVDADGDILDKNGNLIGKAERSKAEKPQEIDYSSLKDKKVNKFGNVVDDKGQVWGHIVQGILKNLVGKRVGDNGEIFSDGGKVIGKAEPIPDGEREDVKEPSPFEDFPNATVADEGKVLFNGEQVGIVVDGDAKKLKGKTVDADGDILDKNGNLLGHAERWEKPEEEPEAEIDMSALAGKRINKAGNAVDSHGDIYGRVIEGDLNRLVGKMCDKQGFIRNEGGDVIGKAELVPEAEREGLKEGPFSELPGCTVNKEGHIVTPGGDIVGRLVSGDPKVLFGRAVDDDGDILDKNGNTLGKAERWEPEEVKKDVSPMSGRKVNREGNVVDENGDLIGKLTSGDLSKCAGKKIDDDGDVVDQKGSIVGHVSLLDDIPEPEPEQVEEESEEDRQKREQLEQDRKIAQQICVCIEHSLDKIRPICKMITENIDKAERTPEDERDEEELVKVVKPLIEEGGKILTEANGVIRGLDPDGRISANAKHKTAAREATPEEYHLADLLKELTGTVTETIENSKRKLEDMQYAKKELNPLWGLLAEPLFQIIAAVGLLLSGVLGLVGKLLNGLGLGGLVNNLLGGLGLTKVLDGLGLGSIVGAVTGQDDKKKKKSGGGKFLGIL
ncbi:putative LEA domain-containing protein [Seiridium cardinale]